MNYKLEKFWNDIKKHFRELSKRMNYKLEKFWNGLKIIVLMYPALWTLNLKSFEIH